MILYLDTSALVKLYVEESASQLVRQAVRAAGPSVEFRFAAFDNSLIKAAAELGMMPLQ